MAANGGTDDGPAGDRIIAVCLIADVMPRQQAITTARRGGLYTLDHDGLRIQCIWKTDEGGKPPQPRPRRRQARLAGLRGTTSAWTPTSS
jgi:hypothetical protein